MLKALELTGFKSFADRTRFEFSGGVSVVVGPNGSGKSNIVDAIKWVLGSQSAKALRGKEMTDVIFNGSGSRGPLHTAEVTLTFENRENLLKIDSPEVHITRRVYRSGEGEYLINREPCRLRDIRDLLAGTGVATEAYSIIEQGKVDIILQSSPRDRRVLFEEAAGISRFKTKKIEAGRRLDRVEQNLLRLSDIVDEVENRLRSVRSQAGKARRYRENADRLQALRTEVGLVDWRALSNQITTQGQQLAQLHAQHNEQQAAISEKDTSSQALDRQLEADEDVLRTLEAEASSTREQIAARQAAIRTERARSEDIAQEIARFRRQLAAMRSRAGNASKQAQGTVEQLREATHQFEIVEQERSEAQQNFGKTQEELDLARASYESNRADHMEAVRNLGLLASQRAVLESQLTTATTAQEQCQQQLQEQQLQQAQLSAALAKQEEAEASLHAQAEAGQTELKQAKQKRKSLHQQWKRMDKQLRQREHTLARTRERAQVLEEHEQRLEGLASGVKEVLANACQSPEGPLGEVQGVVADLFHVDVDTAPLVEIALGEHAQYVVLPTAKRLLDWLENHPLGVAGRVGFLRLDHRSPANAVDQIDLSSEAGVMGRADHFVETVPELVPLVRRLLGRTWFVDQLSTAVRLAQSSGRGLGFVTSDGKMLTPEGTLVVGPRQASAGLLSRRSEIRACYDQITQLDQDITHRRAEQKKREIELERLKETETAQQEEHVALGTQLADRRHRTSTARTRLEELNQAQARILAELKQAAKQTEVVGHDLTTTRHQGAQLQQQADQWHQRQHSEQKVVEEVQKRLVELQSVATTQQIAAAKCEQRVEILRNQIEQTARDHQEREQALTDTRDRLASRQFQLEGLNQTMLAGGQLSAQLYLQKQKLADQIAEHVLVSTQQRRHRKQLVEEIRRQQNELNKQQAKENQYKIAISKLQHERETLRGRMQEDYQIDLATAAEKASEKAPENVVDEAVSSSTSLLTASREEVEREINELRSRVHQIGAVNLDALEELDELESRFGTLSQQYQDLVDAKATLEKIIQRINVESRQIFLTTLEIIRGHFQELFRQLFGGGEADIVMDDDGDVLESGIEITACPPGKEMRSISLLSGGEKTLTCVALLLAVFRSKPSPFCVLDEVDAALDESNIGRFIHVLREFLSFTQFIVVTHSKKTMSGADTLYGVTMQESGISKLVSVRFEDVTEEGQIAPKQHRAA